MLKALLRKQLLEVREVYLTGRKGKDGKKKKLKKSKGLYALFIILYVVILISLFFMSMGIGHALIPAGLDWLYFTILSIIAFLVGIIGSVLSTAQALFRSKDNEFLLALPIPPSRIVFVRMIAVYLMSFLYESVVLIPAIVYYFIIGSPSILSIIFCILGLFVMAFLVTAFSCGAGWLVSVIATKLKNQKVVLTILAVALIGVLYYFQFNASRFINALVENATQVAENLKGWGYPLYAPGLGMTGNIVGFLVFVAITAALFGIAYYAVTKSFAKIALTKAEEKKVAFKRSDIRTSGLSDTLFRRELKRFMASVSYMMNAGLGLFFLLAAAVVVFIKIRDIRMIITQVGQSYALVDRVAPVVCVAAVCLVTSLCMMASCTISMEGKYIWVYQSMPIDPYKIFQAKLGLHIVLTGIPALLCVLALGIAIRASIVQFICMIVFAVMFIVLTASFDLMMDLRRPKLNWTNENQALKTNLTVFIDMLVWFLVPGVIGSIYLALSLFIGPEIYLVIWIAVFAGITLLIHKWLAGRGREIFSTL